MSQQAIKYVKPIFSILFLLITFVNVSGQKKDIDKLKQQRKEKEKEIAVTKKILSETKEKQKKSINQLNVLNRQIKMRQELIESVNSELGMLDTQIGSKKNQIEYLNSELLRLKEEYAQLIVASYMAKSPNELIAFYFSSKSFNQAVKRMQYVKSIGDYRKTQLFLILETQQKIQNNLVELGQIREEKSSLLGIKEQEKKSLEEDKKEENELVQELKKKEKQLKKELAAKEKAARQLNAEIDRLIAEEIKRSKADPKTTKSSGSKNEMALTPEAQKLSNDFNNNKGLLPWPVEKGLISRTFGPHPHPTLKGITTVNNGVDISTVKGAKARAIFKGEVRAIFSIPGMQKAVLINHGAFFTVYTHLSELVVNKGQKVETKQEIGTIYYDSEEGKTEIHLEVWKGSDKLNPEFWLISR